MTTVIKHCLLLVIFIFSVRSVSAQVPETVKIPGYDEALWGLYTLDQNSAFVLGETGKAFRTATRGEVWTPMTTGFTTRCSKIFFINPNIGFCVGKNGFIIKTTDGGSTWSQFLPIPTNRDLRSIFYSGSQLYITGSFGTRLRSTDMGNSWINFSVNGMNDHFYDGKFNGNTGFMVSGSSNALWKSTDGINWTGESLPNNTYALGIQIHNGVIYIFGQNSSNLNPVILRSDNNSQSWVTTTLPAGITLHDLNFSEATGTGFAVGSNYEDQIGRVYMTTDNGLTWNLFYEKTGTQLYSVTCIGNSVIVSGDLGNTYRSDIIVGIHSSSSEVTSYSLSQNYPNPFNPTTKIKFSMPVRGHVTLTIYNTEGKEVETLVNEVLSANDYEYSFTATDLTSGAYFYRLQRDDYVESRKMILLK